MGDYMAVDVHLVEELVDSEDRVLDDVGAVEVDQFLVFVEKGPGFFLVRADVLAGEKFLEGLGLGWG